MKIERIIDGKTVSFELTDAEVEKAYRIRDAHYKTLDIKAKISEMIADEENIDDFDKWSGELPEIPENMSSRTKSLIKSWEEAEVLVDLFCDALSRNDGYWESYWLTMEDVIEEDIRMSK